MQGQQAAVLPMAGRSGAAHAGDQRAVLTAGVSGMRLPLLHRLSNVSFPEEMAALHTFLKGAATSFRIFLDDTCQMPADWRTHWDAPEQWGQLGNENWPNKYAAAGFIPHMIAQSPFVTTDWREASASVVVLFARQYAAGVTVGQQQCLQRLRSRSEAYRATNGSRHFFILTDERGPCCLSGQYKDVDFLSHHIITQGERFPPGATHGTFSMNTWGPELKCYDGRKDIAVPNPNIHFPRTKFAESLPRPAAVGEDRPLLLFYVGAPEGSLGAHRMRA